jgi:hypothetical protein
MIPMPRQAPRAPMPIIKPQARATIATLVIANSLSFPKVEERKKGKEKSR